MPYPHSSDDPGPPAPDGRPPPPGYGDYGWEGGYGEAGPQRTVRDYLLILRERFWIVLAVFVPVLAAAAVYTFRKTPVYTATATIEILRSPPVVMPMKDVVEGDIRTAEDLNTQVRVVESAAIVERVARRLTGEELRRFMAPYETGDPSDPVRPEQILADNRRVNPLRQTLVIAIEYTHPDPALAARVANLFADEYIAYSSGVRLAQSRKAVAELKDRADQQRRKVEQIEARLQEYKETNNMVSLDKRKDIVTEKLKQLNLLVTQAAAREAEAEVLWKLVQQYREQGRPLTDISAIAQLPLIDSLQQQLATQNINISQLAKRYRAKHPRMIEAVNGRQQTEEELAEAIRSAASKIETDYLAARRSLEEAREAFKAQEAEALKLDSLAGDYNTLERELEVEEQLFQSTLARMRETTMSSTIERETARLVDEAAVPLFPSSPNHVVNLGLGAVGGLGLGLGLALLVAFIDDRVKSAFDVESVVGLPLLGIVPMVRKLDSATRAQVVANRENHHAAESFRSLHSALKLHAESKLARVILVTSTIPAEGKSFVAANLALAFAAHGERTLLVDGDLRKPSLHRLFNANNERGLIDVATRSGAPLSEFVQAGLHPHFDLLPTGGRAKEPTELLGGQAFEQLLRDARSEYDRVIIDTPPLAAVSDALTLVPIVDGCVFVLQFNRVRRQAAQASVRRIRESSTPIFGAVLNGLSLSSAAHYYAHYYDRSYQDYYLTAAQPGGKSRR